MIHETTLLKKLKVCQKFHKDSNSKSRFFETAVLMYFGRKSKNIEIKEYCTAVTNKELYQILKANNPKILKKNGKLITYAEFNRHINQYISVVKDSVVSGYPMMLPYFGAIGMAMEEVKKTVPKTKTLPWKNRKFVLVPRPIVMHTDYATNRQISPLINTLGFSIKFKNINENEIINRYLKDKSVFNLTSPYMYRYARRIKNGTYTENIAS